MESVKSGLENVGVFFDRMKTILNLIITLSAIFIIIVFLLLKMGGDVSVSDGKVFIDVCLFLV